MTTATDFLGQQYGVGDWVYYSRGYGGNHGTQLVLAEVLAINEKTVIGRIIRQSRSGSAPTTLTDVRTGRQIYGYYNSLHIKERAHWVWKETGEKVPEEDLYVRNPHYGIDGDYRPYKVDRNLTRYVPATYWEYVKEGPARTVFNIKDNIVKADKNTITVEDKWAPEEKKHA